MEVRPIDGNILRKWCEKIIDQACHPATVQIGEVFLAKVRSMPTLTPPNEPLTLEHLRASPHGKIKDSTLQSICNRANEIACRPPEGEA